MGQICSALATCFNLVFKSGCYCKDNSNVSLVQGTEEEPRAVWRRQHLGGTAGRRCNEETPRSADDVLNQGKYRRGPSPSCRGSCSSSSSDGKHVVLSSPAFRRDSGFEIGGETIFAKCRIPINRGHLVTKNESKVNESEFQQEEGGSFGSSPSAGSSNMASIEVNPMHGDMEDVKKEEQRQ